jgi:thiamine transporter
MRKTFSVKIIAEIAMVVALSTALSFIKLFELPQGGSVTAGSMVPLLLLALRRGPVIGLFGCTLYGAIQFMIEPYVFLPVQVLLDYPIAFGVLGFAGFFVSYPLLGVVTGIGGRFIAHLVSGAVFFAEYAPEGMNPWMYSAIYNGSYLLFEIVISGVLTYLLIKRGILDVYQ